MWTLTIVNSTTQTYTFSTDEEAYDALDAALEFHRLTGELQSISLEKA